MCKDQLSVSSKHSPKYFTQSVRFMLVLLIDKVKFYSSFLYGCLLINKKFVLL